PYRLEHDERVRRLRPRLLDGGIRAAEAGYDAANRGGPAERRDVAALPGRGRGDGGSDLQLPVPRHDRDRPSRDRGGAASGPDAGDPEALQRPRVGSEAPAGPAAAVKA